MRLVLISDTHLRHDFTVPDGNVLIHAGDLTMAGDIAQTQTAMNWLASLPHAKKIVIAGNHDWAFQFQSYLVRTMAKDNGLIYLEDSGVEVEGIRFHGSPWQPRFFDWAFNLDRGYRLAEKWALIPDDTQVLITHGPPVGKQDFSLYGNEHAGCEDLARRIERLPELKLHAFGHIHSSYGSVIDSTDPREVVYVNASICDEEYRPRNKAFIVDTEGWQTSS